MQLEGAKLYGRTQVRGAAGKRIWMTEFGWTAEFGVALRAAEKRWNAVPQFRGVAVAPGGEVIFTPAFTSGSQLSKISISIQNGHGDAKVAAQLTANLFVATERYATRITYSPKKVTNPEKGH